MVVCFLTPIYTSSEKRPLISDHIKGPLVAAFRSPLMKALDRSVETLGLWIETSSVTFIKSANQSSIKPCLIVHLVAVWTLIYFICDKSTVKLLLQRSTGSRTSEFALLSIAVICISSTVVKKTMCFHRVWDFGLLYGVLKDTSSWSVLVFLFLSYE